jgi:hypothetical protein
MKIVSQDGRKTVNCKVLLVVKVIRRSGGTEQRVNEELGGADFVTVGHALETEDGIEVARFNTLDGAIVALEWAAEQDFNFKLVRFNRYDGRQ